MSNHEEHHEVAPEYWEAEENAASIRGIPWDQLWDDEARAELMRRALAGQDVYTYPRISLLANVVEAQEEVVVPQYILWVRQPDPATESRFKPMTWARLWRRGEQ